MSAPLIKNAVKWGFRLFAFSSTMLVLGFVMLINTSVRAGIVTESAYIWLVITGGLLGGMYYWLEKIRREAPEKIITFLTRFNLIK